MKRPIYLFLFWLNRFVCRLMYRVRPPSEGPLPSQGPALVVCDHTSMGDPLVLLATAGRHIHFLMAEEIFSIPHLTWAFQAFGCVPIRRGKQDIQAVKAMLKGLGQGKVMGLFPEGGLDRHRLEEGHMGIGYLALKTGVPIIPASIVWDKPRPLSMILTLFLPCRATYQYGSVLQFPREARPDKQRMQQCTRKVMEAIDGLRSAMIRQAVDRESTKDIQGHRPE